ncbi:uncharacterized protein ACA1_374390 [Acanthamoeba castellanii str. Neff]|uniref:Uncharacterized protein n=1 Tax=Acanthamoeba castellanii (strain ATCC 30010 / Neff) TaxID=1257118 RepID=L8GJK1_ACACF|nr:uncharacterized protein ACA1_374390 [Acanthamoeba castellanii str. Neff]ELR12371.1 hypothetical protein ACA1_374390 [Acanthamoeba castellanii str. Neff]
MGVPQCPTGVLFTRQTGECVSGQFKDSTGNAFSSLMVRPIANSSNYALDFYGGGECLNLLQTNGPTPLPQDHDEADVTEAGQDAHGWGWADCEGAQDGGWQAVMEIIIGRPDPELVGRAAHHWVQ